MLRHLANAVSDYYRGAGCIFKYGLWGYALIPALMGILYYVLVILFIVGVRIKMFPYFENNFESGLIQYGGWFLSGLVISLVVLYLAFFTFKYVVLILSAPFMTMMSQRIEEQLYSNNGGSEMPGWKIFLDLWRSFKLNVRNFFLELLWIVGLFAFSWFFPPIIILGMILWFVQAYFLGFGNMDYTMERFFSYREAIEFVSNHRSIAVGNGLVFFLLFSIPLIGALIAIPIATAASTITVLRILRGIPQPDSGFL